MENNAHTAVSFHSTIVEEFDARYKTNVNFQERFKIWSTYIDEYSAPEHTALDLGCGSGIFTNYLAARNKHVTAIDASPDMVTHCREKNEKQGLKNITYITDDITRIADLTDQQFDIITCSSVLEYIEDINPVLEQVAALMTENSVFLMSLPNRTSLFRKIEPYLHKYIGRPRYYKFVKTVLPIKDARKRLNNVGLHDVSYQYYARTRLLSPICRQIGLQKYSDNQYILVCKKSA